MILVLNLLLFTSVATSLVAGKKIDCVQPLPLSITSPNVLLIGDSISMGSSGYSLFVRDMMSNASGFTLASVQHGGGFGSGGQDASTDNGVAKVTCYMGNNSGNLPPKTWSVITYNAGIHDCDAKEWVNATAYAANLKDIFATLKVAAQTVAFVSTTPWDHASVLAGAHIDCILQRNQIAREIATSAEVKWIDLYQGVTDFCPFNYTLCAIQLNSNFHFYTAAPYPSGQQYTGLVVASGITSFLPESQINASNAALPESRTEVGELELASGTEHCGLAAPTQTGNIPHVLLIGDSISDTGSGYGPAVRELLEHPRSQMNGVKTGALATVLHSGGWVPLAGANEQAGSSAKGKECVSHWVGEAKFDVISMNFGLHDCYAPERVMPDDYAKNLLAIYKVVTGALTSNGSVLWQPTTPVVEGNRYNISNACVVQYNSIARSVLGRFSNVHFGNLYDRVTAVCGERYETCSLQRGKGIHFTRAGRQFTAINVASSIVPFLGPRWEVLRPALKPPQQECRHDCVQHNIL